MVVQPLRDHDSMEIIVSNGKASAFLIPNKTTLTVGNETSIHALDNCQINTGGNAYVQCRTHCVISAGSDCTIDAGDFSRIQTGPDSKVIVGPGSVVSAGDNSEIRFTWWFGNKLEVTVCRIGKNGILPNTPYKIIDGRINVVN